MFVGTRLIVAALLATSLFACAGKGASNDVSGPVDSAYSASIYARVLSGQGSGVVGVPLENVEVILRYEDRSVGPVYTDMSGSFEVDATPLFPEGVDVTTAAPINVQFHFDKATFRPMVEIVTFPVDKYQDYTFHLKGEDH